MAAIARVEVGRFDYDLIGDFKFFKNGVRPTVVVRLRGRGMDTVNTPTRY